MKLYHFCSAHTLQSIKREGLTRGGIPVIKNSEVYVLVGFQWLTRNKTFSQSWEVPIKGSRLKYRRNEFRITIKLPWDDENLKEWLLFCKGKQWEETVEVLNSFGDPENWLVYAGDIKPSHFREIVKNNERG